MISAFYLPIFLWSRSKIFLFLNPGLNFYVALKHQPYLYIKAFLKKIISIINFSSKIICVMKIGEENAFRIVHRSSFCWPHKTYLNFWGKYTICYVKYDSFCCRFYPDVKFQDSCCSGHSTWYWIHIML